MDNLLNDLEDQFATELFALMKKYHVRLEDEGNNLVFANGAKMRVDEILIDAGYFRFQPEDDQESAK